MDSVRWTHGRSHTKNATPGHHLVHFVERPVRGPRFPRDTPWDTRRTPKGGADGKTCFARHQWREAGNYDIGTIGTIGRGWKSHKMKLFKSP